MATFRNVHMLRFVNPELRSVGPPQRIRTLGQQHAFAEYANTLLCTSLLEVADFAEKGTHKAAYATQIEAF